MSLRQRKPQPDPPPAPSSRAGTALEPPNNMSGILGLLQRQPLWMILAIASGACAALNGVFAKLTTTSLTTTLATTLTQLLSLPTTWSSTINLLLRTSFFLLNLLFNALMWALFTAALTRGDSTTRVSIINVSANFMVTAVLGAAVFGEAMPPLWWVGAGLLACGNVVIGRREEGKGNQEGGEGLGREEAEGLMRGSVEGRREDERVGDLLELDETDAAREREERERVRKGEDADAPL